MEGERHRGDETEDGKMADRDRKSDISNDCEWKRRKQEEEEEVTVVWEN